MIVNLDEMSTLYENPEINRKHSEKRKKQSTENQKNTKYPNIS